MFNAGLLRDGSRIIDSTQSICSFLAFQSAPTPELTPLASPTLRCRSTLGFALARCSREFTVFPFLKADHYPIQREALSSYLRTEEAVLQIHLHDSVNRTYRVSAPDGTCGVQLALLYCRLPESPWGLSQSGSVHVVPSLAASGREFSTKGHTPLGLRPLCCSHPSGLSYSLLFTHVARRTFLKQP